MSRFWYSGQLAHVSGRITCLPLMIMLMQLFGGGGSHFGARPKCAQAL